MYNIWIKERETTYKQLLRLRDTVWGVIRTQNMTTRSAHLHQTTGTKDGACTDREAPRAYTEPEGIGYLVETVCRGQ